jgi:two-component sensor histidine kinase/DNA-binding NarL/FixJ family response regulator
MPHRIMVVEDEKPVADVVKDTLESYGYEVTALMTQGNGVLERIREHDPDLVIMDIVLRKGEMDGIEIAQKIHDSLRIPVMYLTGYSDDVYLERAKATEPFGFILKPFNSHELHAAVEMALFKSRAEAELKKHRDHLEELVDERTKELKATNEQLRQEIMERRKAEEIIRAALAEKETLLSEIHHRVKNNLQIISSLLRIQARSSSGKKTLEILKDSQDRIKSMALIHEKLYRSGNFIDINVRDYITDLARSLVRSYGMEAKRITLKVAVDNICLNLDSAIPCGLLINELVANSLKHAFTGEMEGEIRISFNRKADGKSVLTVSDNGTGIPDDVDINKPTTLGLDLVMTLAEDQLGGKLELIRKNGTTFMITFNESEQVRRR